MLPTETARCADCYTVLFADEMNQCSAGHFTCPGCMCDCAFLASNKMHVPSWLQPEEEALHP